MAVNNIANQQVGTFVNPYLEPTETVKAPRKLNFSKRELNNVEIPNRMGKEIRSEKFRLFGIIFITSLLMTIASIFIAFYYMQKNNSNFAIEDKYIPDSWYVFIILIVSSLIWFSALINYSQMLISVKKYKTDLINGEERIPFFLIKSYKGLLVRYIYANWICISTYIICAIMIGIFYLLNVKFNGHQLLDAYTLNFYVIITVVILCSTVFCHLATLMGDKIRKGNIDAYYGFEIISPEQAKDERKKASKRCLITFLIILGIILLLIVIPYILFKRKKGQSVVPFKKF